jgi:hypothetical protein
MNQSKSATKIKTNKQKLINWDTIKETINKKRQGVNSSMIFIVKGSALSSDHGPFLVLRVALSVTLLLCFN